MENTNAGPTPGTKTPKPSTKIESQQAASQVLRWIGIVLILISGFLIWQELRVDAGYILLAISGLTFGGSYYLERTKRENIGPVATFIVVATASAWYAPTQSPLAIASLGICLLTFVVLSALHLGRGRYAHRTLAFHGVALTAMITSLIVDFHLFHATETASPDTFIIRRLLVTLAWLLPGLVSLVQGSKKEDGALKSIGVVLVGAALGKLLFYDTWAHDVSSTVRIASYAISGALTLISAQLLTSKRPSLGAEVES